MTEHTLAQKIHDQCVEAVAQCPQDNISDNLEGLGIADLPDKGVVAVLRYWSNKELVGGKMLWEYSYYKALPKPTQKLFERIDELIDEAVGKAIAKGISEYYDLK